MRQAQPKGDRDKRPWAALLLVALLAALGAALGADSHRSAVAADARGGFEVFGSGNLNCQRWLDDRRVGGSSAAQSEMWIAGFLTAYNHYVYKGYDITDRFEGGYLLDWIDDYCRKRSPNQLHIAAHELVLMLRRRR